MSIASTAHIATSTRSRRVDTRRVVAHGIVAGAVALGAVEAYAALAKGVGVPLRAGLPGTQTASLITTGSFATSGSHLGSYSLTYFATGARTLPSLTSDFHSPNVSSSLITASSWEPRIGPEMALPVICCHQVPVSLSRMRKFWLLMPAR